MFESHNPGLRASDADREAVAEEIREQHLAGRLDTEELQDRLDRCYAAKTYGELDALLTDLPRSEPEHRARPTWRWPRLALLPFALLVLGAVALSHGHLLWLVIPLFFFAKGPLLWGRRFGCGSRDRPSAETYV